VDVDLKCNRSITEVLSERSCQLRVPEWWLRSASLVFSTEVSPNAETEAGVAVAKMNWTRVGKERLLWEHSGGGGRVESETDRSKRARWRKGKKVAVAKPKRRQAATAETKRTKGSRQPRLKLADGTTSWFDHATREAVQGLVHQGFSPIEITKRLGIREETARRHMASMSPDVVKRMKEGR
jgi:hypothetical protein